MAMACEEIARKMGELYVCMPAGNYVQIRTPFLYPDGDIIDLYLVTDGQQAMLTDYGETLRWLRSQTISQKKTTKQKQLIADICLNHGVEFFNGQLMLRVQPDDNLAAVVTRLGQAALRVADLWFTFRKRTAESLTDDVEDFLRESPQIQYARGEKLPGRSGRVWTVDFYARAPRRSSLVNVLSTGSRAASRGIAEHVLAGWYDLSNHKLGPEGLQFVSLFDDTADVWSREDILLLKDLSEVAFWSRPDEFQELLAA